MIETPSPRSLAQPASDRYRFGLPAVIVMTVLIFGRELRNPDIGYPDADRILMDGVAIHDFLKEGPFQNPIDFVLKYYAQYPALSLGYKPPFFPFVEAVFNLSFGVSMISSRLAVIAFGVAGIAAWFALLKRLYGADVAFWSSCLLITTPFVAQWGWYTMLEIPVLSMSLISLYYFHRYCDTGRARFAIAAAVSYALAVWTKQIAVFLSLVYLLHLLATRRIRITLGRPHVWIAIGVAAVMLAPLALLTLKLGGLNISQSIGNDPRGDGVPRYHWNNLTQYLVLLYREQLTLPVLILSLIGMALSVFQRDRRSILLWSLVASTYAFCTCLNFKYARYTIFWLPAFMPFAVVPLLTLARVVRMPDWILPGVLVVAQLFGLAASAPATASGYRDAAELVLRNRDRFGPMVFIDAYNGGYLTYFLRVLDPDRGLYVLRGDKLLTSSAIDSTMYLQVHAESQSDIAKIFDRYGIGMVVVESTNYAGVAIHDVLRQYLQSDRFQRIAEIPVHGTRALLDGQTLKVYGVIDRKEATADEITIPIPLINRTITVPLKHK